MVVLARLQQTCTPEALRVGSPLRTSYYRSAVTAVAASGVHHHAAHRCFCCDCICSQQRAPSCSAQMLGLAYD